MQAGMCHRCSLTCVPLRTTCLQFRASPGACRSSAHEAARRLSQATFSKEILVGMESDAVVLCLKEDKSLWASRYPMNDHSIDTFMQDENRCNTTLCPAVSLRQLAIDQRTYFGTVSK